MSFYAEQIAEHHQLQPFGTLLCNLLVKHPTKWSTMRTVYMFLGGHTFGLDPEDVNHVAGQIAEHH